MAKYRKGRTAWNKGKKLPPLSEETRKKMRQSHSRKVGEEARNWKGGITKHSAGYILIFKPSHPYSSKIGYVKRSRLVMEKHLGRYLKSREIPHHKNGIKDDDRIENLFLFANRGKHIAFHNHQRKLSPKKEALNEASI